MIVPVFVVGFVAIMVGCAVLGVFDPYDEHGGSIKDHHLDDDGLASKSKDAGVKSR